MKKINFLGTKVIIYSKIFNFKSLKQGACLGVFIAFKKNQKCEWYEVNPNGAMDAKVRKMGLWRLDYRSREPMAKGFV